MFTLKTGFQLLYLIGIRKYIKKVKINNNASFECSRLWRVNKEMSDCCVRDHKVDEKF